jgi:serine/threonine protein kinase
MGEVWLARHTILNKDVAVKFLLNMMPDERDASLEMFLEGARAASAIQHMGLNPVVHADVAQGVPFLVMEYVDGPTVADILRMSGKLPLAAARVVIEDAVEAVGVLHDHGIVHRDIKPSNILLTREGRAVLTDFGLACPRPVLKLDSQVEGVAGTPTYMAPEMFEKTVTPRSDVYALGITALEVLTGHVPFEGTFDEIREAHLNRDVPQAYVDALPAELRQVLTQAMTKKAMFRVKTASHLHRAMVEAFASMEQGDVNRARGQAELARLVARWLGVDSASAAQSSSAATPPANATYYDRLGTLADSRKRATPIDQPDSTLVDRVTSPHPCTRCGAELLDQPLTGRCPQCLLLVRLSMGESMANPPPRSGPRPSGTGGVPGAKAAPGQGAEGGEGGARLQSRGLRAR